jgi:hypothetical protein
MDAWCSFCVDQTTPGCSRRDHTDPLHVFKTEFYREALRSLLCGRGPAVYGLGIDFSPSRQQPVFVLVD